MQFSSFHMDLLSGRQRFMGGKSSLTVTPSQWQEVMDYSGLVSGYTHRLGLIRVWREETIKVQYS